LPRQAPALSLIPAQLCCRNYTSRKAARNKYLTQAIRCMYRELDRTLTLDGLAGGAAGGLVIFSDHLLHMRFYTAS